MEGEVNKVVQRRKDGEDGFSYVCQVCDFDCVGRKGIMKHLKEGHKSEVDKILAKLKGDDTDAQLVKLVMNAAFAEEESEEAEKNGEPEKKKAKQNGVEKTPSKVAKTPSKVAKTPSKATKVKEPEPEPMEVEEVGRKEYPVTLDVLKMIDARTLNIPNYGSLVGRIARLVAVVVGKEEKEGEEVSLHCYKCDQDLAGSYPDIMPHLEAHHTDFLGMLNTIFPPAKKRMGQFVEKAAAKFDLKVPTEKDVEALRYAEEKEKQKERDAAALKRKQEWDETKKTMAAAALKRKLEYEEERKKNAPPPMTESKRRKLELEKVKTELKKTKWSSNGSVRKRRLEKRREELVAEIKEEARKKYSAHLEKRTTALMENLSPKQLRKLCMNYFGNLGGEEPVSWKETLESIKMEGELGFVADFLVLLYDYARGNSYARGNDSARGNDMKKGFKIGHMLVTSKQAQLILEKGLRSHRIHIKASGNWRIPSSWDVENPSDDLGEDWTRKDDSRLLTGAAIHGKNLAKIVSAFTSMKDKIMDSEGVAKKPVKERFAYLLNVFQNRGKYNEEFGLSMYTEDVNDETVIELLEKDDDDDVVTVEDDVEEKKEDSTKEETPSAPAEEKEKEKKEEEKEEKEAETEEVGEEDM